MRKRDVKDLSNGITYYTAVDLARRPARSPFGKKWCKMALSGFDKLSKLDVTLTDLRVLFVVMSSLEDKHRVYVNQTVIARQLAIYQPAVSKSMRRLLDLDVLRKTPGTAGRFTVYHLNPYYAWYGGDNEDHYRTIKDWQAVQ